MAGIAPYHLDQPSYHPPPSRLANGLQAAAILSPHGISSRSGDLVNQFASVLAPAELDWAVHGWQAPLAPVQARVGETELHTLVDGIHVLESQHIAVENVHPAVGGEAVVAARVGAVVFPERARAFGHVELVGERFIEQLLAEAVA